jgi:hypothetical protein
MSTWRTRYQPQQLLAVDHRLQKDGRHEATSHLQDHNTTSAFLAVEGDVFEIKYRFSCRGKVL